MKLEVNHKKKIWKDHKYMEVKEHATKQLMSQPGNQRRNFKKYMERNENEDTTVQNLWDAAKVVLRGKYIAIQVYLKKQEKSQINNLTLHLKVQEKEQQTKPKNNRRKEIISIRADINVIETKKNNRTDQ